MPEKAVYSLTASGELEFERLMKELSTQPIRMFLDFNAVIVNLDSVPIEMQKTCVANIEKNVQDLKTYLEENLREKENAPEVPEIGMAVLRQQFVLAETIETWNDVIFSLLHFIIHQQPFVPPMKNCKLSGKSDGGHTVRYKKRPRKHA